MPTIFLSYSRADLPFIERLETQLKSQPDISIWRDQENIYGGQNWPKVLGEAIADQDVFLLAWSKHSAVSHFVEFEWCTAIALKKTIVPCLLDETPLPAPLRTFHGCLLHDTTGLIQSLRGAPLAYMQRREPVIRKLSDITTTEETAVLAQAKTVFAQQQWTVPGNVYQAGGDIHIHHEPSTPTRPEKTKPLVERWQAWATLAVAILTAVTLLLDLPAKWGGSPPHSVPLEQPLSGTVLDEATGEPLQGVVISLPDFDMKQTTEADGHFRFRVVKEMQARIKFTAEKIGYKSYTNYATLGNTDLRFPMEEGEGDQSPAPSAPFEQPLTGTVLQKVTSERLSVCGTIQGVGPEMILLKGGSFEMGSSIRDGRDNEGPTHPVRIKAFSIGTCEITFDEYEQFARATNRPLPVDGGWGRGMRPVIGVSWGDAKAYAQWLSQQTGKRYRLPTESEWEYAARSSGTDAIWAGSSDERQLKDYAVYGTDHSELVGSKKPNMRGLYDMSGNVLEWVEDCWHEDYKDAPKDGSAWLEVGGGDCSQRVLRGGSWNYGPGDLRVSYRIKLSAGTQDSGIGFRLARDIAIEPTKSP